MELEQDVLIEILSRLPVETLIRLTCVRKYWLSIIRSTEFATIHYATRLRQLSNNRQEHDALLTTFFPACSISILSYENLTFQTAFKFRPAIECEPPRFGIYHRDIISDCFVYGPCNGLFLLQLTKAYENVLLLWNPATREVFSLPDTKYFRFFYVGFGYDDVTNDYKVVCFNRTEVTATAIVLVYSLAANSWRQIDARFCFGPGKKSVIYGTPSTSNGRKHHWIVCDFSYEFANLISFDMVDEKFIETRLPDETKYCHGFLDQGSNSMYPTLYYLDDMIEHTRGMHVWVLKGYGPTGYWEKREYITLPDVVSFSLQMVLWKNRKIVFSNYADLDVITWYDLLTREMKSLHIPGDMSILGYIESLFSIANFARRPPPRAAAVGSEVRRQAVNAPGGSLQQHQPQQQAPGGEQEEDQEVTSADTVLIPEENDADDDDEDDNLSTDSAFQMPNGLSYLDPGTVYLDYRTDERYSLHRRFEWHWFAKLPYCLREVNQPIPPNPCTFQDWILIWISASFVF